MLNDSGLFHLLAQVPEDSGAIEVYYYVKFHEIVSSST